MHVIKMSLLVLAVVICIPLLPILIPILVVVLIVELIERNETVGSSASG
jgi:hypothetical protein